jgi:hypothetical protein
VVPEPPPTVPSTAQRVAVVVVAGVGDSPKGQAAERVANGLTVWGDFTTPEEQLEWFRDEGEIIRVQRLRTTSPHGAAVDVVEFWWADLSRFPAALRSFLAAFIGLFLAFPAIGLTALRDGTGITEKRQDPFHPRLWRRLDFHLLGVLTWLMYCPVVAVSAAILLTVGVLSIALGLRNGSGLSAVALALCGTVLAFVLLGLLRHYERRSGRWPVFALGAAFLLAAVGICVGRLWVRGTAGGAIDLALADTATVLVAYPMRIVWLAVIAAAAATTCILAIRLLARRGDRRGRTLSALITVGVGPLGISTLMAIFSAAIGAAAQKVSKSVTWTGGETPLCLVKPDDWTLHHCADDKTAWDFGSTLLTNAIYPLAWASAVTVTVVALLVVWGLLKVVFSRGGAAARLTGRLAILESPATVLLLIAATLTAAYFAAAAWLPVLPLPFGSRVKEIWGPPIAAILGGAVTTLLVAARVMGLSPGNLVTDGKAPGGLRAVLDKPYDIATFLREPLGHNGLDTRGAEIPRKTEIPRKKMLRRFRGLMEHLAKDQYDRVVFVAHSQGTVLTTALLANRQPDQNARLPKSVSLMTFGCPLRQLYLNRFPSQYAWVAGLAAPASRCDFVHRVNGEWANVAAADDPIGRTVFMPPPKPWTPGPGPPLPDGTPRLSELLLGTGGHGSYWNAQPLYEKLAALVDA